MSHIEEVECPEECPICMEPMDENCDKTVTKCGHSFHSSCIFQNMAAHNGFGCPYCRTILAKEIEESDDDSIYAYSMDEQEQDYVFTSFRMFHQQINNEDVEDEDEAEDEDDDEDQTENERQNQEQYEANLESKTNHIVQHLNNQGITYKDLVRHILLENHCDLFDDRFDYTSSVVYGQFRAAISQYERNNNNA